MKIALVVGHRQSKQGAEGSAGISEFEYWSQFAKDLADTINSQHDVKVYFRRDEVGYSTNMKLLHKQLDANAIDVAIELHFNASTSNATGCEVLYATPKAEQLATSLYDNLAILGNTRRGVKHITQQQRGYKFLAGGNSINILTEPFFATEQISFMFGTTEYQLMLSAYTKFIQEL